MVAAVVRMPWELLARATTAVLAVLDWLPTSRARAQRMPVAVEVLVEHHRALVVLAVVEPETDQRRWASQAQRIPAVAVVGSKTTCPLAPAAAVW
jgi:hypothetical protein